jgi:hypothetical protein
MTLGKETPMNSTPGPKPAEPHEGLVARADERLVHAHEEIKRADEQLARLSEQVARMERNAARAPRVGPQSPGRRTLPVLLPLAACIVVAVLVWHSSYGGGARPVVAPSPPQLASSPPLPPDNPQSPAQPAPPAVQLAAAGPAQAMQAVESAPQATPKAMQMVQAAPQDAAPTAAAPTAPVPTAAAAPPDQTPLLQTMARDLANLQRSIEQLKAAQQQMAGDNAKEIAALRASQEEMKRVLAKASEQNQPKTSPPPAQPTPPAAALRKPERTVQSPRERPRPRSRRDYYYDDDW